MIAAVFIAGLCLASAAPAQAGDPAETFPTSLHATRPGKAHWYSAANGGFEKWTGVEIGSLGCAQCHGASDADGAGYAGLYPGPSCLDCHATADHAVSRDRCLGCHGRQAAEAGRLKLPDVHRDAGMVCWDCHGSEDVHGDGEVYESMLEPGAIKADCAGCHPSSKLPESHAAHDPHDGALHCTACHSSTVVTCYNCHFESQAEAGVKRAMAPLTGFVLLVNRTKDDTVHAATFQSLTHRGAAFVAFAPYTPHTTVKQGRRCGECHLNQGEPLNAAAASYRDTGTIPLVTWNAERGGLEWMRGVVPIPPDYPQAVRMEFMTFDGDPKSAPGPDAGSWSPIGKDRPDGSQMLFASPLTEEQMVKLGMRAESAEEIASLPSPRTGNRRLIRSDDPG